MSRRNILLLILGAVILVVGTIGGTIAVTATVAQKPRVPSDAALFVFDTNTALAEDGHQWEWNDDAYASLSESDSQARLTCPPGSTNVASFMATFGNERTPSAWTMWEFLGYGTNQTSILLAPLTPDRMGSGAGQGIHKSGGTFSLGIACTKNNNLDVTAAYYRAMTVQPGGLWTLEPVK